MNYRTALALAVAGLLIALGAISGVFAATSNALSRAAVIAGMASVASFVAVALLAWSLLAAQIRKERLTLSRSMRAKLDGSESFLTGKIDRLDAKQRKTLNVLRGAVAACEDQDHISSQLEASRVELTALQGISAELGRLSTRVLKSEQLLDVAEARNRKMLNLMRAESRSSLDRFSNLERQLGTYESKAMTATTAAEETSVAVRKMHNFLRRDGNIQLALDHFVAAERRVLQALDAAALDHGDSLAGLESTFRAGQKSISESMSALSQLSESHSALSADVDTYQSDLQRVVDEYHEHATAHAAAGSSGTEVDLRNSLKRLGADNIAVSRQVGRMMADRVQRGGSRQSIDVVRQVEALLQLVPRVDTSTRRFPPSGWWALPADTLLQISDYVRSAKPKRILEIGSGSSTVWVGTFAKEIGSKLVTLEHDLEFAQKSVSMVAEYGLSSTAVVHYAPLKPVELEGIRYEWYDSEVVSGLGGTFDMLIVDGPPEATGEMARYPALPLTKHLLSDDCLIILDDTHRGDEKKILRSWAEMNEGFEVIAGDLMRSSMLLRGSGLTRRRT